MTTKTSPLSSIAPPPTTTTTANNLSAVESTAEGVIKIKKEFPSDEIKEFAETTMNELLGWYGIDDTDRMDLSTKPSRLWQLTPDSNATSNNLYLNKRHLRPGTTARPPYHLLDIQENQDSILKLAHHNNNNNNNNNHNNKNNINNNNNSNNNRKSVINCNTIRSSKTSLSENVTSDHETRSSREEDSKSPHPSGKIFGEEKIDSNICSWCRRSMPENAPGFLTLSDGPRYCSESCFTQSRRASFKKAKTCDWCKHVRHAVSYVDFQDGASQLQFCSDKCLNQYKMQIFCKETQAHLDMNPHLRDQGLEAMASGNGAGLITPDLWLKNCRSRSASPASTISVSPGSPVTQSLPNHPLNSPIVTPTGSVSSSNSLNNGYRPLISVAPVSKLMSKSPTNVTSRPSPKHSRKKKPQKNAASSSSGKNDLSPNNFKAGPSMSGSLAPLSLLNKPKPFLGSNSSNSLGSSGGQMGSSLGPSLSQFAGSSVQDLHMSVPPLSPMMDQPALQVSQQNSLPLPSSSIRASSTVIPPGFFATATNGLAGTQTPSSVLSSQSFLQRPPFFPSLGAMPRLFGGLGGLPQFPAPPPPAPPSLMGNDIPNLSAVLGAAPPPVTVMVPYPVIIPLPLPIPVPLPVSDFYKAYLTPEEREKFEEEEILAAVVKQSKEEDCQNKAKEAKQNKTPESEGSCEEPLDFTKTSKAKDEKVLESLSQDSSNSKLTNGGSPSTSAKEDSCQMDEHLPSPSPSSPASFHCIVPSSENCQKPPTAPKDNAEDDDKDYKCSEDMMESDTEAKQKLPKFKITRLQTKRTLLQVKESECSRPLRKRKRLIDCDFQKIALKDSAEDNEEDSNSKALESEIKEKSSNPSNNNNDMKATSGGGNTSSPNNPPTKPNKSKQ